VNPNPVHPEQATELVEGAVSKGFDKLSPFGKLRARGGFDRLSPNGTYAIERETV
jgi:hypothetical protein